MTEREEGHLRRLSPPAPPYELIASELAVRALVVDEQPEGEDFDYSSLADALDE